MSDLPDCDGDPGGVEREEEEVTEEREQDLEDRVGGEAERL